MIFKYFLLCTFWVYKSIHFFLEMFYYKDTQTILTLLLRSEMFEITPCIPEIMYVNHSSTNLAFNHSSTRLSTAYFPSKGLAFNYPSTRFTTAYCSSKNWPYHSLLSLQKFGLTTAFCPSKSLAFSINCPSKTLTLQMCINSAGHVEHVGY